MGRLFLAVIWRFLWPQIQQIAAEFSHVFWIDVVEMRNQVWAPLNQPYGSSKTK